MKKTILAVLAAVSFIALNGKSFAAENTPDGFNNAAVEVITVEKAKSLGDDTFVILRGSITKNLGDDVYVFADGTGSINIEIDEDEWNGQPVSPEDMVEIRGQIDKGWTSVEIDVDQIQKINK